MAMSPWLRKVTAEADRQFIEYWNSLVRLRHVKMDDIIVYGWGAGFNPEQTLHECVVNGYAMCIAEPAIKRIWAKWDADYEAYCLRDSTNEIQVFKCP